MEMEGDALPAFKENMEVHYIPRLFEQTALLAAQLFNSLASQRRLDVINMLVKGGNKVTNILKERYLDLGD